MFPMYSMVLREREREREREYSIYIRIIRIYYYYYYATGAQSAGPLCVRGEMEWDGEGCEVGWEVRLRGALGVRQIL